MATNKQKASGLPAERFPSFDEKMKAASFQPGESGNPDGRPRADIEKLGVRQLARLCTLEAVQVLYEIATTGKQERSRVAAAEALLDRGHGRPTQSVDLGETTALRVLVGPSGPWAAQVDVSPDVNDPASPQPTQLPRPPGEGS